jgi:hypothetical protein
MQSKSFTVDWFSVHIPHWEVWLQKYKGKPDIRYLEIGSFQGRSLTWMLDNILTHETAKADAVDIWVGSQEHTDEEKKDLYKIFLNNIAEYPVNKIDVHRGYTVEGRVK